MEYREWHVEDKSDWGDGPWQNEPDKVQFMTKVGLPALIVRNHGGALCGYVGIEPGHPFYGKDYSDHVPLPPNINRKLDGSFGENIALLTGDTDYLATVDGQLSVHGGVTFAGACQIVNREKWEKWREDMLMHYDEVDKHPQGDWAERWKVLGDAVQPDGYPLWEKYMEARTIRHVTDSADVIWWLGFDCSHYDDYTPSYSKLRIREHGEYRDIEYVKAEIESLAAQLMQKHKVLLKQEALFEI